MRISCWRRWPHFVAAAARFNPYEEHAAGQAAIRELVSLGPDATLGPQQREQLARRIEAILEHAFSCGTLLSHLDTLDRGRCERLLKELCALRNAPARWTDLPRRRHGPTEPAPD